MWSMWIMSRLTWQASTFPSMHPAHSIVSCIIPLYDSLALHVFVSIIFTGAFWSNTGHSPKGNKHYQQKSCSATEQDEDEKLILSSVYETYIWLLPSFRRKMSTQFPHSSQWRRNVQRIVWYLSGAVFRCPSLPSYIFGADLSQLGSPGYGAFINNWSPWNIPNQEICKAITPNTPFPERLSGNTSDKWCLWHCT